MGQNGPLTKNGQCKLDMLERKEARICSVLSTVESCTHPLLEGEIRRKICVVYRCNTDMCVMRTI